MKAIRSRSLNGKLEEYVNYLIHEEKSTATIEKYSRDVGKFIQYLQKKHIDIVEKEHCAGYKRWLTRHYKPSSVESMIVPVNGFLKFLGHDELTVKHLHIQRMVFADAKREMAEETYHRLVSIAYSRQDERTAVIMETICATGIRVSELKYITVEALARGKVEIYSKGKIRNILISRSACRMLLSYCRRNHITSGSVFITKNGKPVNRSDIWKKMKQIAGEAGVSPECVYPHNLRHVFAKAYYDQTRDLVKLAALLGHSDISTTRLYLKTDEGICISQLDRLRLVDESSSYCIKTK